MTTSPIREAWLEQPLVAAPFDQYQRYRITGELVAVLTRSSGAHLRVLDIGGHHVDFYARPRRPIADALPAVRTVTVDLASSPLPGYVRAFGHRLPFRSNSFDFVASVDVLEHVPSPLRERLLAEATRVTGDHLLIAAPFSDPRVEEAERLLSAFVVDASGHIQGQLAEHRERGLPDLRATVEALERLGWHVLVLPYGNLWRWLQMMLDKHLLVALPGSRALHQQLDEAFNRQHFESDRSRPCYRHFLVATRTRDDAVARFAAERFGARPLDDWPAGPPTLDDQERLALARLHAANLRTIAAGEPQRRDAQLAEAEAHRADVVKCLAAQSEHIARIEGLLREVEGSLTYRIRERIRRVLARG